MNHFDLLSLPISYSIDLKDLDRQYFALQVKYHPDRTRDNVQKTEFAKQSMQINQAYKILQNDYTRASYLLKLQNIDIENEGANYPLSPAILQQIWEAREELDEAQDIAGFLSDQLKAREALLLELGKAFDMHYYEEAAVSTLKLRYLDNLITSAKAKQQNATN